MQANYKAFVDRLISRYEGGYCWDKNDPGGPTKYGITCFDLAEYRKLKMTDKAAWVNPVKALTLAEAEDIYAKKYAVAVRFDELVSGVDVVMMDYAVNSGPARAVRVAAALCGRPGASTLDSALLARINSYGAEKFISDMCAERLRFMHAIRGGTAWLTFGKGWLARVTDLKGYAIALARSKTPAIAVNLSKVATPKAHEVANARSGTLGLGAAIVGVGTFVAGNTGVIDVNNWTAVGIALGLLGAAIAWAIWNDTRVGAANRKVHI